MSDLWFNLQGYSSKVSALLIYISWLHPQVSISRIGWTLPQSTLTELQRNPFSIVGFIIIVIIILQPIDFGVGQIFIVRDLQFPHLAFLHSRLWEEIQSITVAGHLFVGAPSLVFQQGFSIPPPCSQSPPLQ